MFERDSFKNNLRTLMIGWTEEQLDSYTDTMEKKYSTVKKGENVIHLEYIGGVIDDTDISNIEKILSQSHLELSRLDSSGIPYAAIEDFMLQIALCLNDKTTQDVLVGLGSSALWDTIKSTAYYLWQTVRNRTATILTAKTSTEAKLNVGIHMTLDKNRSFDFKINGELSDNITLESLDKILDFLKAANLNHVIEKDRFVIYNKEKKKWEAINIHSEIMKQINSSGKTKTKKKKGSR